MLQFDCLSLKCSKFHTQLTKFASSNSYHAKGKCRGNLLKGRNKKYVLYSRLLLQFEFEFWHSAWIFLTKKTSKTETYLAGFQTQIWFSTINICDICHFWCVWPSWINATLRLLFNHSTTRDFIKLWQNKRSRIFNVMLDFYMSCFDLSLLPASKKDMQKPSITRNVCAYDFRRS